jgi:cytochrome P450
VAITETCPEFERHHMTNIIHQLREALVSLTNRDEVDGWTPVEMLSYLSHTGLDIIGLAGFNYSFDSIHHLQHQYQTENALSSAFGEMMRSTERQPFLAFLKMFFPPFRLITWDARSRMMRKARRIMEPIGQQLVNEKRQALQSSKENGKAKDLLTLLIKANMNEGGEKDDRRLSDREVLNQIPTFLIAGERLCYS